MGIESGETTSCVILLSGGIDSATCVHFFLHQDLNVGALHVNYGQVSADNELLAAQAIAGHYGIPFSVIHTPNLAVGCNDLSIGRNALLLIIALAHTERAGIVVIGIHAGSGYPDCSDEFVSDMQRVYDRYAAGTLQITAPFASWTKADIWRYAEKARVPLWLTYSCDLGRQQPCGECQSCKDSEALNALS